MRKTECLTLCYVSVNNYNWNNNIMTCRNYLLQKYLKVCWTILISVLWGEYFWKWGMQRGLVSPASHLWSGTLCLRRTGPPSLSLPAPAPSSQVSLVSHAAQSTLTGVTREDNPEVDKWNCLSMEMQEKEN